VGVKPHLNTTRSIRMSVPERKFGDEFFSTKPPVIPVKFSRPKGKGTSGTMSWKGFEGFKLIDLGDGGDWSVMKTSKFTLKCLADGYAEVPDTAKNREKLKLLLKPQKSLPTYDRAISIDKKNPEKFWFRNNKGLVVQLTEEALDKGEIRLVNRGEDKPAIVTKLKSLREFDVKNPRSKDSDLAQRVRPWLQQFVKVDAAVMSAAAI